MRVIDPEADLEHEGKQQQLVDEIMRGLYEAAREKNKEDRLYGLGSRYLLETLIGYRPSNMEQALDFQKLVILKIDAFTKEPAERSLLRFRVLERLVNGLGSGIYHEYRKGQMVS